MSGFVKGRTALSLLRLLRWNLAICLIPAAAAAQAPPSPDHHDLPRYGGGPVDGAYPVRLLTIETARMLDANHGTLGLGDARYAMPWRRVELVTHTITDIVGVANLALKLGLREPAGGTPGVVLGIKYYQSYPGLINEGVRKVAESFSDITDADVDVSGVVGYATASWIPGDGATGYHLAVQGHLPSDYRFTVADSVNGGGGTLVFEDGRDLSVLWGVDHRLVGDAVIAMAEAGWSFGLERARFGVGVDAGTQRWRFVGGMTWPGVETDVATEPRDFFVNPVLSIHYRF